MSSRGQTLTRLIIFVPIKRFNYYCDKNSVSSRETGKCKKIENCEILRAADNNSLYLKTVINYLVSIEDFIFNKESRNINT